MNTFLEPDWVRQAKMEAIANLATEADRLYAYFSLAENERIETSRLVLMCSCADWLACEHPYPQRMGSL